MSTPQQRGYTTSISPPMGRRARVLFSNDSALRAPRLGQQLVIPVQHPDHTSVGLRAPNPYRSACPPAHSAVCHLASTISSLVVAAGHSHFRERADLVNGQWLEAAVLKAHDVQHELNNHLALTTGYAELLADNPHLPPDLQDAAREALVGGLGAMEAGKRLISCFTTEPSAVSRQLS